MTGNGNGPVYTVEARLVEVLPPKEINGMILDTAWRHVATAQCQGGVPNDLLMPYAADAGFLTYEAAMALAWWFMAGASWRGVEMRLVEHQFTYSYAAERKTEGEPFRKPAGRIAALATTPQKEER